MSEKKIAIHAGDLSLDALVDDNGGERAALVCHPHPQYGGDMYNNVVRAVVDAYRQAQIATLRFNFRDTARGDGFDQAASGTADVRAAIDYLRALGKTEIDLIGYSFGAWIAAVGLETFGPIARLVMISPPVELLDFSALKPLRHLRLVITGAKDGFAPPAKLKTAIANWNPEARLEIIARADHFYVNNEVALRAILKDFIGRPGRSL
jgi:uncharacterized protein